MSALDAKATILNEIEEGQLQGLTPPQKIQVIHNKNASFLFTTDFNFDLNIGGCS